MLDSELLEFARRIGLESIDLSEDKAFSMLLDEKYILTLEYSRAKSLTDTPYLIVSCAYDMGPYDHSLLQKALTLSSYLVSNFNFSVGYNQNRLILMSNLALTLSAAMLEQTIIKLKEQLDLILDS